MQLYAHFSLSMQPHFYCVQCMSIRFFAPELWQYSTYHVASCDYIQQLEFFRSILLNCNFYGNSCVRIYVISKLDQASLLYSYIVHIYQRQLLSYSQPFQGCKEEREKKGEEELPTVLKKKIWQIEKVKRPPVNFSFSLSWDNSEFVSWRN